MLKVEYSSDFVRKYKRLTPAFKTEVRERIEELKIRSNHEKLRVHKLKGAMKGLSAFSVNYQDRIVFEWSRDAKTVYLLDIGDHSIYE